MTQISPSSLNSACSAPETGIHASAHDEWFGRVVQAQAHGKAILVGEHSVIYGSRAIAFPVKSVGMNIHLTPLKSPSKAAGEQGITIRASLGGRGVSDHLKSIILEAFEILQLKPFSLEIEGVSSGLIGAGMGSSATLCVVILKALSSAVGRTLSLGDLAAYANRLERHFHGNPSGLDTAVVAFESPLCFRIHSTPTLIHAAPLLTSEDLTWPFVLLDSTTRSSTIAMVKGVAPYFLDPSEGARRIERFDDLAVLAERGLKEGDPQAVASSMVEAGRLLAEAGASSTPLDEIIDLCHRTGCLAAKPTGAGGGGCVLALLDPSHKNDQLSTLRSQLGSSRVILVNDARSLSPTELHG